MNTAVSASLPERFRGIFLALTRRGARLRLPQTAASLAFLSLLALVPVFTIAVSLLGALPALGPLRESLMKFMAANLFLPTFSDTLVRYLNQFAAKVNELSLVGAAAFLATAFSAMLTIDRTLNRIWGVEHSRSLTRRLTLYWMFLTLGPLLLAATLAVNGIIVSELFGGTRLPFVERLWLQVLPWLTTLGGLTLLYRLVPNATVRWGDALGGAIAAAIALDLLKRGFAFQVAKLPTYTVVYGAFAALPLFLLWLFLLWLTVLGGALLAASLPYWGADTGVHLRPSAARRFEMAAGALAAMVEAAGRGQATVALRELSARFEGDPDRAERTARLLAGLGYLDRYWQRAGSEAADVERAIWDERWALRPGAGSMTLRPLFERLWNDPVAGAPADMAELDLRRIDRALADPPTIRREPPAGVPGTL